MDKIINKSIEEYLTKYKMDIRDKMMEQKFPDDEKKNKLLEFVFDYDRLTIKMEELKKITKFYICEYDDGGYKNRLCSKKY
jgi:hypothetical protein